MSEKEIPLRELRVHLSRLVEDAHHGHTTIITKHGRPYARIAPLETPMTFTSRDLRDQVVTATDASDGTYDVDAIVEDIVERHGAVPVDDLEHDEFWEIVAKHATD